MISGGAFAAADRDEEQQRRKLKRKKQESTQTKVTSVDAVANRVLEYKDK